MPKKSEDVLDNDKTVNEDVEQVEAETEENTVEKNETVEEKKAPISKEEETFKSQLQRLQAEFMNYKKRVEKEKIELSTFVKGEFVKRFVPVLDDLTRVRENMESDDKALKDALGMVFKKLEEFTAKEKIELFAVAGDEFDPNLHEALMQVPTEDEKLDHTLAQVFEQGYKVGDKIIRFAKVQVYQK